MSEDAFRGILYVMDSLRYDALGCHGGSAETPTMDRLAEEGVDFERAYAQAIWTYPSAGSIFTGLYPESHGSQQFDQGLDPSQPHVADLFAGTDVETACFSTTLGVSPARGFDQSFDEFYHLGDGDNGLRPDIMAELSDTLLPWVERQEGGFFAVVWAMGTHHPYLTPTDEAVESPSSPHHNRESVPGSQEWMRTLPADRVGEVRARYDRVVAATDRHLGELIETLEAQGDYEATELILTADHGELFDEHARAEHGGGLPTAAARQLLPERLQRYYGLFERSAFVGHQAIYPYEELIRVPLVVKPRGDRSIPTEAPNGLVELVDLLPTFADSADRPLPAGVQGTSLYRQLDSADPGKERVFSTSQIHGGSLRYRSVTTTDAKLCRKELDGLAPGDLRDPGGRQSLAGTLLGTDELRVDLPSERPQTAEQETGLSAALERHVRRCREATPGTAPARAGQTVDVDAETEAHLADLGYR